MKNKYPIVTFLIFCSLFLTNCSPGSVDLSIDMQWVCWTVMDSTSDEPIFGATTTVTVINISDEIVELTLSSNTKGETCFSRRFGGTITYAEISA